MLLKRQLSVELTDAQKEAMMKAIQAIMARMFANFGPSGDADASQNNDAGSVSDTTTINEKDTHMLLKRQLSVELTDAQKEAMMKAIQAIMARMFANFGPSGDADASQNNDA